MIEIKKESNSNYRFSLKTVDGNTLLNSVGFNSQEEVDKTVKNLFPLLEYQRVFERKTNHSGKFLFNLKDTDGKIIGSSRLYSSEAGMENGIKNLIKRITSLENSN